MQAGKLRERVTIKQSDGSQDSFGAETGAMADVGTFWAAIEPLNGREFFEAQQEQSQVTTRIRIRHQGGITPQMVVVWGTRIYEIVSVINPEERDRELVLMCTELVR